MLTPATPPDEVFRLAALRSLNLLDTAPDERFDRLTRLARHMFNVPIALFSLVDDNRQWFKSCLGLDVLETPREISFCGHAILGDDVFVVTDALQDARFSDNPLVTGPPHLRFYAGCPLRIGGGHKIGTLCLLDSNPRQFDQASMELLRDLAHMAERELAAIEMASVDELTQMANWRGFEAQARHALELCRRLGLSASMLFFDLDQFKQINDRFGHAEGDRALALFAGALRKVLRDSDVVGRRGGDEFAVFLSNCPAPATMVILQRLRAKLDADCAAAACEYRIKFSAGCTEFDTGRHSTIGQLLDDADAAMYAQKQARD